MGCFHPVPAVKDPETGKLRLWAQWATEDMQIGCGKCGACIAKNANHWAQRIEHEASTWPHNEFITLTYDDAHLPTEDAKEGGLSKKHLQTFIKRLRQRANRNSSFINRDQRGPIRYFAVGEYGEDNGRPHYHGILLNAQIGERHQCGASLVESDELTALWGMGLVRFEALHPGGAAQYVTDYMLKATTGGDPDTGAWRPPPFRLMSRKPPLGMAWLKKYSNDLTHGYITDNRGRKQSIPRSYTKILQNTQPELADEIQTRLEWHAIRTGGRDDKYDRLRDQEHIHNQHKEKLKRRLK